MDILALVGSYRKKGNTARIVQMVGTQLEILAGRAGESLTFEVLYLGDMDIRPCRGCRTCFDRGEDKCPLRDDIPAIKAKMDAADALILASPVYVDDVSGLIKNFMDRLAYVCHRPAFAGKCAFSLATAGSSRTKHTLGTMNTALVTWGFHLVGHVGYKMGGLTPTDEMERYRSETTRIAEKLFRAVTERHALHPRFVSLLTFKIQQLAWQRGDPATYDYAYRKAQGWLEPDRTFYVTHHASLVKVALARALGAAIAPFVI